MKSPLPVRHGVGATRLRLPEGGFDTILDYVMHRFGHVDADGLLRRFDDGEVVGIDGTPIRRDTPLSEHEFLWYYREVAHEDPIPFTETVLYQDEHVVAVDKPHFLPTTPGGKFVQESALVRLRNRLDLPDLIPMHRLDRATAGVVLFAANPATRGKYQTMFQRRSIRKRYECVSALPAHLTHDDGTAPTTDALRERLGLPLTYRNRMTKVKGQLRAIVEAGEPNAETAIDLIAAGTASAPAAETGPGAAVGHFALAPHTGKTHQLRVHMAALGLGILNDAFYPDLWDLAPDDYSRPLQLLARSIEFTDPLTRREVRFDSQLTLASAPAGGSA
ncbi:pseudouridine synthase [Zhihengliuella flava]|uniref:RNA pseudouridylate synthase n=1 Tax=Zhihengliuella flava TaxID=1285193 RepID=A0A931GJB5_9MICC|nr:pseudouridine synthase [Zhihengliuella flava]MBG6085161.1 tRNA pseudouridine32 synthase/23S rRNA pseudouridine746 synthase [Zhihengliuella flava]